MATQLVEVQSKFILKSKTIFGGLLMIVGFLAQLGFQLPFSSAELQGLFGNVSEIAGFIFVVLGRIDAGGVFVFKKPRPIESEDVAEGRG